MPSVLDMDHFRYRVQPVIAFEEQGECAANADNTQGGIVRVEQKDVTIQKTACVGRSTKCEDTSSSSVVLVWRYSMSYVPF